MYAPREIAARLFIDHGGARARDGKSFPRRSIRGSVYSRYINAQFRASANSIGVGREIPSKELAKITAHFRIVHGLHTTLYLRREIGSFTRRHVSQQCPLFPLRVEIVFAMNRSNPRKSNRETILQNHTRKCVEVYRK